MKPNIKVILAMLIWGSIGIFVKNVDLPSTEIVFYRAAIASVFLVIGSFILKKRDSDKSIKKHTNRGLIWMIFSGIIIALNWLFLFEAYKYTTIANATLSYYLAPVFVVLLSPIIFKEKLTAKKLLSVSLAMIGLGIIVSQQSNGNGINYDHIRGIMFGLMAAILYAGVVLINKGVKGFSGFDKALIQILTSAIVLLPEVLYRNNFHIYSVRTLVIILLLGIVHTGIAYTLYFSSIEHISVQRASLLSYIDPLSAVVFGTIFLSEPLGIFHIIGGTLILFSTFLGSK